jgi:asparagine synthase (glutamine-hydrolysing)
MQIEGPPRPLLSPDVLGAMMNRLEHRGPNDSGSYVADGVALGVRRLSIVDVAGGHQPFGNEDGRVWAVQNGELYNHDEVRRHLDQNGHRLASRCDTEVLPHLYEELGDSFPTRLRGMFAAAVWDGGRHRGVIARDRLGKKPLYYAIAGDVVVFASELKSLLASGLVSTELDGEAIDAYLTLGFFPAPMTPLRHVRKLLPGAVLAVGEGAVREETYWDYPQPQEPEERRSEGAYREELLALLDDSVRMRLMSDVPLGAMLSGGLDSSIVVALMARHQADPVKTFAVGFVEAGAANELGHAREVARALGTDHHEIELSLGDADVDLEELVWRMDEPVADLSALGFLALSELAARHVTVALSGQGADELLGGYRSHRNAARLRSRLHRMPMGGIVRGFSALGSTKVRRVGRVLAAADPFERYIAQQLGSDPRTRARLGLRSDALPALAAARRRLEPIPGEPLDAALYLDARLGLVDDMLHYFDRASMAHSLEVRVPFLDHRLVEFCSRLPRDLKVRNGTGKYLLREAARGLVPPEVLTRPKVGFFNAAVSGWFQSQVEGSFDRYVGASGVLDRTGAEALVVTAQRDPAVTPVALAVVMLEVWLSSFLSRAITAPGRHSAALVA